MKYEEQYVDIIYPIRKMLNHEFLASEKKQMEIFFIENVSFLPVDIN